MTAILWRIASFTIPVPLALLVALGLWIQFDKASSVRKAVNAAVVDLVAGEQLAAANAKLQSGALVQQLLQRQLAAAVDRANAEADARTLFEQRLALQLVENRSLQERIADVEAQPLASDGLVGKRLYDRLHNK